MVNTHPDEDHCGGLAAVLAKYPVEHVYSSVTEYTTKVFSNVVKYTEEQGRQIEVPQTGTHWSLGSAAVTVIGPVQEYSDPNNGSLVLRVCIRTVNKESQKSCAKSTRAKGHQDSKPF